MRSLFLVPTIFLGGQPAEETDPATLVDASYRQEEQFLSGQPSGTMSLLDKENGFLFLNIPGRDAASRT